MRKPGNYEPRVARAIDSQEFENDKDNLLELEVGQVLESIQASHKGQFRIDRNKIFDGIETDFLVTLDDRTWVIECDGLEHHYFGKSSESVVFGRDVIQDRVFRARKFEVLHIPIDRWREENNRKGWLCAELGIEP